MRTGLDRVVAWARSALGGSLLGAYLHGSAVTGGLRPDSDLDLLVVTARPLSAAERTELVALLLRVSGRRATEGAARPLDVTVVVRGDVVPWRHPPVCDLQYGEWLRDDLGRVPERRQDANLALVLASLVRRSQPLAGPPARTLLDLVPPDDVRRAIHDTLPPLLGNLVGDERNVLLTLARMVTTLETGSFVSKDAAAEHVLPGLPAELRPTLRLAAAAYRGEATDDWSVHAGAAQSLAAHLTQRIGAGSGPRVIVLVEGPSDAAVVRTLARARGITTGDGVEVVPMGGITNVGRFLDMFGLDAPGRELLGLCDAPEERFVVQALRAHGVRVGSRKEMAEHGFFVCEADLEHEMLRAVGTATVEGVLASRGELARFRAFQRQPGWRGRSLHDQLHRFAGSGSGRKPSLTEHLAQRLTPATTPEPLARLLDRIEHHAVSRRPSGLTGPAERAVAQAAMGEEQGRLNRRRARLAEPTERTAG
ncbi:aminoglycoside adenylyltransferase family protein [Georgenia yuyongxinii]|uniref:aminoglycoside adenylyltransferase family protein n=1 Tax=Georgenia yuyongxinii TaxID=2589797 RepID=UPI00143DDB8A|nr:aminoglycoside adenylyltransferase family protein [Georgenia yuyongxinii]